MMFPLVHGVLAHGSSEPPLQPDAGVVYQPYSTQAEDNQWSSVAYGAGLFVAVSKNGTNRCMTSPDGYTWTARPCPSAVWERVRFLNNKFYAVGTSGSESRIMESDDGITWNLIYSSNTYKLKDIAYGNGRFVVVESNNTDLVLTASDSDMVWNKVDLPNNPGGILCIAFGNGVFVAPDTTGGTMVSTDGIIWSSGGSHSAAPRDIAFGNGVFVAAAVSGHRIITSTDGQIWTNKTPGSTGYYCVAYGNGRFSLLGGVSPYHTAYSDDGISWFEYDAPASMNLAWQGLAYGDGKFVGVFNNYANRVCVSPPV